MNQTILIDSYKFIGSKQNANVVYYFKIRYYTLFTNKKKKSVINDFVTHRFCNKSFFLYVLKSTRIVMLTIITDF